MLTNAPVLRKAIYAVVGLLYAFFGVKIVTATGLSQESLQALIDPAVTLFVSVLALTNLKR